MTDEADLPVLDCVGDRLPLHAYRVSHLIPCEIAPAPVLREWMSATRESFANRCLPLLVANQAGRELRGAEEDLRATWNSDPELEDLVVERADQDKTPLLSASSHFGHGILTFTIPFLFRTPPGWNLLARGPANLPKDGISALEGLVETDWSPSTFTMNWKLTRPGLTVSFAAGEPIALIVPMRRGDLESFDPEVRELHTSPEVSRAYRAWRESRAQFLRDLPMIGTEAFEQTWQKDYMHGRAPDGTVAREHQRRLNLKPFKK